MSGKAEVREALAFRCVSLERAGKSDSGEYRYWRGQLEDSCRVLGTSRPGVTKAVLAKVRRKIDGRSDGN